MFKTIEQAVAELRDFASASRHSPEPAQAVADLALLLAEQSEHLLEVMVALVPPEVLSEMQRQLDAKLQAPAPAPAAPVDNPGWVG